MKTVERLDIKQRVFDYMKNLHGSKKHILDLTYASLEDVIFTKEGKMKYNVGTERLYEIVQTTYELLFER